ncbi:hypothetical protein M086_4089, partial [Bacteroides fragilis str. S13 L11]
NDTELSFLAHPAERPFDTKYKKLPEAGHKTLGKKNKEKTLYINNI